jgi:hypothetical protein
MDKLTTHFWFSPRCQAPLIHSQEPCGAKAMMAYHVLMTKCKQSLKHGAWCLRDRLVIGDTQYDYLLKDTYFPHIIGFDI